MAADYVRLPADAIPALRQALAWGLHATAEVARVQDALGFLKQCGHDLPAHLGPVSPHADGSGLTRMAEALLWLDDVEEIPDTKEVDHVG